MTHKKTQGTFTAFFQDVFNPWLKLAFGAGNCNQDKLRLITEACPGWELQTWTFDDVTPLNNGNVLPSHISGSSPNTSTTEEKGILGVIAGVLTRPVSLLMGRWEIGIAVKKA